MANVRPSPYHTGHFCPVAQGRPQHSSYVVEEHAPARRKDNFPVIDTDDPIVQKLLCRCPDEAEKIIDLPEYLVRQVVTDSPFIT